MPSLPSPEPTVSYFDDLDFFKDFENEFPAIVYNDTQMSKSDLLTEPILSPQHIDEFDLNDETSLSEYDEEEQNVLNFNVIYPNDSKSDKDNDDELMIKPILNTLWGIYLSNHYLITVYTVYSLNEYSVFDTGPRERNIDEYWWRIYKSKDREVLES
ncbi:hypothetical protein Tco_0824589 [Tanacetum coccineum]|uniref:Uncharacterized protein n=1 Tax=Tanacetum coccineum TaxID=301880 RepID=A0ABQ5ALA0_9ASTR